MARKYMITSYPIKAMIAVIQLSYQYLLKKKMVFAVYPGVGGGGLTNSLIIYIVISSLVVREFVLCSS